MKSRLSSGFALPTVLMSSVIMLIVMLSAVTSTVAIRSSLHSQYYNQLARTAGEAGAEYAKACLAKNDNIPSWGATNNPLKPNTDCNGVEIVTCTDYNALTEPRCSVLIQDKTVVSFTVDAPISLNGKAFNVNSIGNLKLYRGNGVNVEPWRQYQGSVLLHDMPSTPVVAIAAISGVAQISQILTAGAITPAAATVSYQWQSATSVGGVYSNINGATSSTYAVSPSQKSRYLKVVATGTGLYSGTQVSTATSMVPNSSDWLTIGTQTWASKNLNVGTRINGINNPTDNSIVEKYCYNNLETNCTADGALYQWNEAMNYAEPHWIAETYTNTAEGAQGICPAGSHIPTDNEWKLLEINLGMSPEQADLEFTWRGTDEGTKLKQGGSSGLNLPLGGMRYDDEWGAFGELYTTPIWTSTENGNSPSTESWIRYVESSSSEVFRQPMANGYGIPVRCLGN